MKKVIAPVALAVVAVAVYGTFGADNTAVAQDSDQISQLQKQLADLRSENSRLKASSNVQCAASGGGADLPSAKPGECYARILVPAQYETTKEKVVDREASERVEIIPAQYESATERVVISEASERLEIIPATYKTVTETVVVEPARKELRTVPAKYETKTERVLVRDGYTAWKKGSGPIGGSLSGGTIKDVRGRSTGEIMCLVEVPPEYRNVTKKVLAEPAKTTTIQIPAVTKTVRKRVIDKPATTKKVPIPAQYDTVRVRKEVRPPTEKRTPIPATYKTLTKNKQISEEKMVWREILCETNTTPDVIRRVQAALNKEGFSVGSDGILGPNTLRAIDAYQRKNSLGTGGLTMATVKKLGVM